MTQAAHDPALLRLPSSSRPLGRRVVWLSSEDQSKAFDFDVAYICLHAISKDPGTFPTPCIYCQVSLRVTSGCMFSGVTVGHIHDAIILQPSLSLCSPDFISPDFISIPISPPLPVLPSNDHENSNHHRSWRWRKKTS